MIGRQFSEHPGNYLAFFSSFEYLRLAAQQIAARLPAVSLWQQGPSMTAIERAQLLERFQPTGQGGGLAVLGGAFSDGIDLPGKRPMGAFGATLGLLPV